MPNSVRDAIPDTDKTVSDDNGTGSNPFVRVDPGSLVRQEELFVEPSEFPKKPESNRERVFIIEGEGGTGRLIAAINLALLIRGDGQSGAAVNENSPIYIYQQRGNTLYNLNSILINPHFERNSVYIIPDIVQQGLSLSSLSQAVSKAYEGELYSENTYFILTVDAGVLDREDVGFRIISTAGVDMAEVLKKHQKAYHKTDFFDDEEEEQDEDSTEEGTATKQEDTSVSTQITNQTETILKAFTRPKQIGTLFLNLQRNPPANEDELKEMIRWITSRRQSDLRRWFRALDMNTKVFVMLVALLIKNNYTLTLHQAEEFYYSFVQKIRRKPGMDGENIFIDPRRTGIEDIVVNGNMHYENNQVSFRDEYVLKHVVEVEVQNYHNLLWVLVEMLVDQLAPPDTREDTPHLNPAIHNYIENPDMPRLLFDNAKEVLANLVGYIGISRQHRLQSLLHRLAKDDDYRSKMLVGEVMRPLARETVHHSLIQKILDDWIYPHRQTDDIDNDKKDDSRSENNPDTFFATTRALSIIYGTLVDRNEAMHDVLYQYLQDMGEHCGHYRYYINHYEQQHRAALQQAIQAVRESEDARAITENQEEELYKELDRAIARHNLHIVEDSILELILLLNQLITSHPRDVVHVVSQWLQYVLDSPQNQSIADEDVAEDEAIAYLLSLDEALSDRETDNRYQNEQEQQKRRRMLNNMAWHVGMMATSFLYEQIKIQTQDKDDDADSSDTLSDGSDNDKEQTEPDISNDEQDESQESANQQRTPGTSDDTDEENPAEPDATAITVDDTASQTTDRTRANGIDDEEEDPLNTSGDPVVDPEESAKKHTVDPEKDKENDDRAESQQKQVKNSQQRRVNRLAIRQMLQPLLDLLPLLLKSSSITFSPKSLMQAMTRGDRIWSYYEDDVIDFRYLTTDLLLQSNPLQVAFRKIHDWYTVLGGTRKTPNAEGRDLWMSHVYPAMLSLFNTATHGQRPLLRELLFAEGWIDSPHKEIQQVAHALLARSYVLDGRVMDLPTSRHGVVLLDGGLRERRYQWGRYYRAAYRIIQKLTSIVPLHVYRMGSVKPVKKLGQYGNDTHLKLSDLKPRRTTSRLLTPLFEARHDGEYRLQSENTHFVLVLSPVTVASDEDPMTDTSRPDLLDLPDLVADALRQGSGGAAADPELLKIIEDPFYTTEEKAEAHRKLEKMQQQTSTDDHETWSWKQKLYIVSPNKGYVVNTFNNQVLPQYQLNEQAGRTQHRIEDYINIIGVRDATFLDETEVIEQILGQSIGRTLHSLSVQQWQDDLSSIWATEGADFDIQPDFDLSNVTSVARQLSTWAEEMGDVTRARHPRDITMTIVWTVLTLSRQRLDHAVQIVRDWLDDGANDNKRIMGIACAKSLFNFYRLDPDFDGKASQYSSLLDILPAFTNSEAGSESDEFLHLFSTIMLWARLDEWVDILLVSDNDGSLQKSVRNLKSPQAIGDLRRLVALHETTVVLARLYVQSGLDWRNFRRWLETTARWFDDTPVRDHSEQIEAFAREQRRTLNETSAAVEILRTIARDVSAIYATEDGIGWLLDRIGRQVYTLGTTEQNHIDDINQRVRKVANSIRLQIFNRTNEPMPPLTAGRRYGVIMLPGSTRQWDNDQRLIVTNFVKYFRQQMSQSNACQRDDIVLTIHHMGRSNLLYNNHRQPPSPKSLRLPDGTPSFAPLISPILEKYPLSQTAFVLVVSDDPPLDLGDWRHDQEWVDKMFLYARSPREWIDNFFAESHEKRRHLRDVIKNLTHYLLEYIGCKPEDDSPL